GSVTLIAGATVTVQNGGIELSSGAQVGGGSGTDISNFGATAAATATVDFTSGTRGDIDLETNNMHTGTPIIDTSSTSTTAGDVTLAAYYNASTNTGGRIILPANPATNVPVINTSSTVNNGGNVLMIAGRIDANSITVSGDIQTGSAPGRTG